MTEKVREKPNMDPIEHDEMVEAFDSRRIREQTHPDLGFTSREEVEAAIAALNKLIAHPDVSARIIGKYRLLLEQQRGIAEKKEIAKKGRRAFLKKLVWSAGLGVIGGSAIKGCSALLENQYNQALEAAAALEATHTLGMVATTPSYRGWFAYYPRRDANITYTETGVALAVDDKKPLQGNPSSVLYDTGFFLKKHEHRSGEYEEIIPKILVVTQRAASSSSSDIAEEWVLRKTDDSSSPDLDPSVMVLEKRDPLLTQPLKLYLQVKYLGSNRFGVNIMQIANKLPR